MERIDLEGWERRDYFEFYLDADFPYINIGANVDVTGLLAFARRHGLSSYLTLIHTAHQTAEGIVNFRYRIKDREPVVNERLAVYFTHLPRDRELFINVLVDDPGDVFEFQERAQAQIERQGTDLGLAALKGRLDIIGYSAVPWVQYTHFVRTIRKLGVDSNPKISWGKYFTQGERTLVPFSVQVHHGLMDGLQVGRYFEDLQRRLNLLQ
jgi:chloramphenicol O-acetyltransferase type A